LFFSSLLPYPPLVYRYDEQQSFLTFTSSHSHSSVSIKLSNQPRLVLSFPICPSSLPPDHTTPTSPPPDRHTLTNLHHFNHPSHRQTPHPTSKMCLILLRRAWCPGLKPDVGIREGIEAHFFGNPSPSGDIAKCMLRDGTGEVGTCPGGLVLSTATPEKYYVLGSQAVPGSLGVCPECSRRLEVMAEFRREQSHRQQAEAPGYASLSDGHLAHPHEPHPEYPPGNYNYH
ncbi:hypothetical protein GGR50DRAFT_700278, partial [Xylaria sp. CBS 124048]